MVAIRDIYKHTKTNSKPLLMDATIASLYPSIEGNTSNFVTYYLDNYQKLDKVFTLKYSDKKAIFLDEKDAYPAIYNEWIENCNDFVAYYMDAWAHLFYGLHVPYNPTWNYDGKNVIHTEGTMEGLSGSDTVTSHNGATSGDVTEHSVPYDSTSEKETGKTTTSTAAVDNSGSTTYGRKNDVDYTVTETKGGNQGTTSTQQLLSEEYELAMRSFWDVVFTTLSKELTIW